MKTVILTIPEKSEKWFRTLFNRIQVRHKILTDEGKENLLLAKLIDEAMQEEGEVEKEKVIGFVRKHGT